MKNRILSFFSKVFLIMFTSIICIWMMSGARADTNVLKDIKIIDQANGRTQIKLSFEKELAKEEATDLFRRNFLQLSLKNVSAYPAINKTVDKQGLSKVIAYQYTPSVARVRFVFDEQAEQYKKLVNWEIEGNIIKFNLWENNPLVGGNLEDQKSENSPIFAKKSKEENLSNQEKELLQKVISSNASIKRTNQSIENEPVFSDQNEKSNKTLKAASPTTSIVKMVGSLSVVLGILLLLAFLGKKYILAKLPSTKNTTGLIDVISNQVVGPKQSVSLVKVGEKFLLLGVAEGNVSLISDFGKDLKVPDAKKSGSSMGFDNFLSSSLSDTKPKSFKLKEEYKGGFQKVAEIASSKEAAQQKEKNNIRNSIQKKLQNFKKL